jgi:hypothetical protein
MGLKSKCRCREREEIKIGKSKYECKDGRDGGMDATIGRKSVRDEERRNKEVNTKGGEDKETPKIKRKKGKKRKGY